jgi:hypothetical protein
LRLRRVTPGRDQQQAGDDPSQRKGKAMMAVWFRRCLFVKQEHAPEVQAQYGMGTGGMKSVS